jgi:hypothetical protein
MPQLCKALAKPAAFVGVHTWPPLCLSAESVNLVCQRQQLLVLKIGVLRVHVCFPVDYQRLFLVISLSVVLR